MSTPVMNHPHLLNAEDVANELDRISDEAAQVGAALDDADRAATMARLEYDYEYSRAYVAAEGPAHQKVHVARIRTYELAKAAETADLLMRQLKRKLDRISRIDFEACRTKAASHRAETASFGPGSVR